MSAILDSLRKLEREKTGRDAKPDLKSLLLQLDYSENEIDHLRSKQKILLFVSCGLFGMIIFLGLLYYQNAYSVAGLRMTAPYIPPATTPAHPVDVVARTAETTINPGAPQVDTVNKVDLSQAQTMAEASRILNPIPQIPMGQSLINENKLGGNTILTETDSLPPSKRIEKKSIFKKKYTSRKKAKKGNLSKKKKSKLIGKKSPLVKTGGFKAIPEVLSFPASSKVQPVETWKTLFPRFDLKGAIFFGEGNPANYVMLRNEKGKKINLKKGDKYLNAKVVEIFPRKVRFQYKDHLVEMGMGKETAQ